LALLWFATTRDAAGTSWKGPTRAEAWRQLEVYLWTEFHKWAGRLHFDAMGPPPFGAKELLRQQLNLRFGSALAVASDDPVTIGGVG
jgi:hypothetical protein